jgi:hypothetical protein
MVSEARTSRNAGARGQVEPSLECPLIMLRQGVLPRQRHLLPQQIS